MIDHEIDLFVKAYGKQWNLMPPDLRMHVKDNGHTRLLMGGQRKIEDDFFEKVTNTRKESKDLKKRLHAFKK